MNRAASFSLAAALAFASGCAGGSGDADGDASAEACEHAIDGPASSVIASAADDGSAPDISAEHTRHDVTLVARDGGGGGGGGDNGGFVRIESAGGPHVVFLSADIPIAFVDANGTAIDEELQQIEDTCPEIATAHHVDLPVGIVSFDLGPTTDTEVSIIVERVATTEPPT